MKDTTDDLFSEKEEKLDANLTLWLTASTKAKYTHLVCTSPNKRKIIARLRQVVEKEIDNLIERAPVKMPNCG